MFIVNFAQDKKAEDIVILDLRKISSFSDFFVITSGMSKTHLKAIADGIREGLQKQGVRFLHREGYEEANWILLDYGDVIVHIFDKETRGFYDLEHLWADAKCVLLKREKGLKK